MRKVQIDQLSAMELAYKAGHQSVNAIAKEFGIPEASFRRLVKKSGWIRAALETKRQIVADAMAGVTKGMTNDEVRHSQESEAEQDVADMTLGLKGARAILQCAVDSIGLQGVYETPSGRLELILEPKDQKILSECIRINVDTIRRIRGLDLLGQAIAAAPLTREELDAFKDLS